MSSDYLLRGTTLDNQFRIFAVNATNLVQTARDRHDLSPISTLLLGRLFCAVAMLSWDLKNPLAELTIRVDAEGHLQGALVICNAQGHLRGYAFNPKLFLPEPSDNFFPGKALGKGTLTFISSEPKRQPHIGTIELVSGEIAEDIAHYLAQSEQIPSAVNLGILIDKAANVRSAGGFIIQQLPDAEPAIAEQISNNIYITPNLSDLMDMGLSIEDILNQFVLKGINWQTHETKALSYRCNCSKKRFGDALILLGRKELETMQDGISPICHYCNTQYHFSHIDMADIIKRTQR